MSEIDRYNESDIQDFEKVESQDNALILKELKSLRAEIDRLNGKVSDKSDEQKRDEILSIKDSAKRHKAIAENMDVFNRLKEKAEDTEKDIERRLYGRG